MSFHSRYPPRIPNLNDAGENAEDKSEGKEAGGPKSRSGINGLTELRKRHEPTGIDEYDRVDHQRDRACGKTILVVYVRPMLVEDRATNSDPPIKS